VTELPFDLIYIGSRFSLAKPGNPACAGEAQVAVAGAAINDHGWRRRWLQSWRQGRNSRFFPLLLKGDELVNLHVVISGAVIVSSRHDNLDCVLARSEFPRKKHVGVECIVVGSAPMAVD